MIGDRRDTNTQIAERRGRPKRQFPTSNVEDLVVVEDVLVDEGFKPLAIGMERDQNPALKLVIEQEMEGDGGKLYCRRIWATTRNAQEAENLSKQYLNESPTHPTFIRTYLLLRSDYTELTAGTTLKAIVGLKLTAGGRNYTKAIVSFTGGGGSGATAVAQVRKGKVVGISLTNSGDGYTSAPTVVISGDGTGATATASIQPQTAVLVKQEMSAAGGELGNLFVQVQRVWMTLPGPILESSETDEDGAEITVTKQLKLLANITVSESTPSNTSWIRVSKEPVTALYGYEVKKTRSLPGGWIDAEGEPDSDGIKKATRKRLIATSQASCLEEVITESSLDYWRKYSSRAVTGMVVWEIEQKRLLPGPAVVSYLQDEETKGTVEVTTQIVKKPSSPPAQVTGVSAYADVTLSSVPTDGSWVQFTLQNGQTVPFEFDDYVAGAASTVTMTFNSVPVDGTIFTLTRPNGTATTFEFDSDGSYTYGRTVIETGGSVSVAMQNTIAAVLGTEGFSAVDTSNNTVQISRTEEGAANQTISSTITGAQQQIETATGIGDLTLGGTAKAIVTAAGMTGSPKTFNVTVLGTKQVIALTVTEVSGGTGNIFLTLTAADMANSPKSLTAAVASSDSEDTQADAIAAALNADSDVTDAFTIDRDGGTGVVRLTRNAAAANDATMELSADGTTETIWASDQYSSITTSGVAPDNVATWVGKVRTALAADGAVTALFSVGGTGANITLTRLITTTNDATLNISLENGTCSGITAALTSSNTQPGIAPPITLGNFSGGVTGSEITGGRTRVVNGATALDTANNLITAAASSGTLSATLLSSSPAVVRVTRNGVGNSNTSVTKSGSAISVTQFSGGDSRVASVEYRPDSNVHGKLVTMSLLNYSSISRVERRARNYQRPNLLYGVSTNITTDPNDRVNIAMNWNMDSAKNIPVLATHTYLYNTPENLIAATPYYYKTKDLRYVGVLFPPIHITDVLCNTINLTFSTQSSNTYHGYVAERIYFAPTSPSASGYSPGTIVTADYDAQPWKYGLYRSVKVTLPLP